MGDAVDFPVDELVGIELGESLVGRGKGHWSILVVGATRAESLLANLHVV